MNNVCRASSVIRVWIIGSVSTSAESSASAEVTEQTPVSIKTAEALAFSLPCKLPHLMRYAAIAPCIPLVSGHCSLLINCVLSQASLPFPSRWLRPYRELCRRRQRFCCRGFRNRRLWPEDCNEFHYQRRLCRTQRLPGPYYRGLLRFWTFARWYRGSMRGNRELIA